MGKLRQFLSGKIFGFAVLFILCSSLGLFIFFAIDRQKGTEKSHFKDKFDELEFAVIHRPHLTYFIDTKYFLCFATRKPDYQDLVQFICPERMWKEVVEKIRGRAVRMPKSKTKTEKK